MASQDGNPFNPDDLYDQFPEGREEGQGTADGYNTYVRLNDPALFAPEALEANPALRLFAHSGDDGDFVVAFVRFKSSTRESEWALHKPNLTLDAAGQKRAGLLPKDLDIAGEVDNYPGPEGARIATLVIDHERTLSRWPWSALLIEDGQQAGQLIYKHPVAPDDEPSQSAPA